MFVFIDEKYFSSEDTRHSSKSIVDLYNNYELFLARYVSVPISYADFKFKRFIRKHTNFARNTFRMKCDHVNTRR